MTCSEHLSTNCVIGKAGVSIDDAILHAHEFCTISVLRIVHEITACKAYLSSQIRIQKLQMATAETAKFEIN